MVRLDEQERLYGEAAQQARMVEGMALASRAKPDYLMRYVEQWRDASRAPAPAAARPAAKPVDPSQVLGNDPFFRGMVRAALAQAKRDAQPPPVPNGAASLPAPETVYRVERTRRA